MEATDRPLVVATSVPRENGIQFAMPHARKTVRDHTDLVWAILGACDGHTTRDQVISAVSSQLSDSPTSDIIRALDGLEAIGVLLDSRRAFQAMLPLLAMPSPYSTGLTPAEVHEHVQSPRLPVAQGTVHQLTPDPSGALAQILAARRSCRSFSPDKTLDLSILSRLLISTYSIPLHSTPSGGALYPLKIYLILTKDHGGLEAGYYEYDPERHELVCYDELDAQALMFAFNTEPLMYNAPAIVVISADLERQPVKYGNFGLQLTMLEAGQAAQNLLLASTEAGLSTLEVGGFRTDALATELRLCEGLDEGRVRPFVAVAIGYPGPPPAVDPQILLEQLSDALTGSDSPVSAPVIGGCFGDDGPGFVTAYGTARNIGVDRVTRTSGASWSSIQAKIAAIAEGYERNVSGLVRVELIASADELTARGERWLDPRVVAPLSAQQSALLQLTPFRPDCPWQWVKGTTASGQPVWVPIDLVYYPCPTRQWGRTRCTLISSSGVAAFTDAAEAAHRGLLELVERHALMTNWFQRTPLPKIPSEQLSLHWHRRVSYWKAQGRRAHVLDMNSYARGLIAVNVVIESDEYPFFVCGAAASTTLEDAISRAFLESERGLCGYLQRPKVDLIEPRDVKSCGDHGTLYAASQSQAAKLSWLWSSTQASSAPWAASTTPSQLLSELGAVVVVVSPPNAPLDVVRVLSPELVPISFGYGHTYHEHRSLSGTVDLLSLVDPHYFP